MPEFIEHHHEQSVFSILVKLRPHVALPICKRPILKSMPATEYHLRLGAPSDYCWIIIACWSSSQDESSFKGMVARSKKKRQWETNTYAQ